MIPAKMDWLTIRKIVFLWYLDYSQINSSYQMLMIIFYEYDANNNKFSKYN